MRALLLLLSAVLYLCLPGWGETIVVNFQTVFQEYEELRRLDAEFRAEVETYKEVQQAKVAVLEAKQQEFAQLRQQAAQAGISEEERSRMAERATVLLEEMNQAERELREERQSFEQELEAKGVRLRRKIVQDVNRKVAMYAEQEGWDLVLDSSAVGPNGLPVIPYARQDLDKTRWLITELNQDFIRSLEEAP